MSRSKKNRKELLASSKNLLKLGLLHDEAVVKSVLFDLVGKQKYCTHLRDSNITQKDRISQLASQYESRMNKTYNANAAFGFNCMSMICVPQ
jgi:hypothetical protein